MSKKQRNTVQSRYNGPSSNGNPPIDYSIMKAILKSLEKFFFNFYIGNKRNQPVTDKMSGPLKSVRAGVNCSEKKSIEETA